MREVEYFVNIFLKYNANFPSCHLCPWRQQTSLIVSGNTKCLLFMRRVQRQEDKEQFLFAVTIPGFVLAFTL